jgi:hypothetical protein
MTIEQVALVGDTYVAVDAWDAVMVTVPAPFKVTKPVLAPTVANDVLLLLYVTAPELALLATTANDASVTFFVVGGLTNASVGVARVTVSALLVTLAAKYVAVAACDAVNVTIPVPTIVIAFPDPSAVTVATDVLLLVYVIVAGLLLVGRVVIANGASLPVLNDGTVNVDVVSDGVSKSSEIDAL